MVSILLCNTATPDHILKIKEYSSLQKVAALQKQCCPLLGDCSAFWADTSATPRTVCSLTWHILKSYSNPELWSQFFPFCLEKGCMNDICQTIMLLIPLQRGFLKAALISKARSEHYLTSWGVGDLMRDTKQECRSFHFICSAVRGHLHPSPPEGNE